MGDKGREREEETWQDNDDDDDDNGDEVCVSGLRCMHKMLPGVHLSNEEINYVFRLLFIRFRGTWSWSQT